MWKCWGTCSVNQCKRWDTSYLGGWTMKYCTWSLLEWTLSTKCRSTNGTCNSGPRTWWPCCKRYGPTYRRCAWGCTVHLPCMDEVQWAIRKLRNGWAAGPNETTPELLKTAQIPISMALHRLFLLIWKSGKVLADWKEAVIMSLYKGKGSRSQSLLLVPGKVFAHVLLQTVERKHPLLTRQRRP